MPISAQLLAILACPSEDHAPLQVAVDANGVEELVCTYCATRFAVVDGIPVLLLDDAVPGPNGVGVSAQSSAAPSDSASSES